MPFARKEHEKKKWLDYELIARLGRETKMFSSGIFKPLSLLEENQTP